MRQTHTHVQARVGYSFAYVTHIINEGGSPAQLSSFIRAETTRVKSVVTRVVATGFAS
jgi:hypothetical protein